jgi:PII-like signaling protein
MSNRHSLFGSGICLRIFIGEAEEWQGKPLYLAILDLAREQGMAGATVIRGVEGFGPGNHLVTERLPDIADNLPLLVEVVDGIANIERFLSLLDRIVLHGMITMTPVEIVQG